MRAFFPLLVVTILAGVGCSSLQADAEAGGRPGDVDQSAVPGWQFGEDTPDDLRELADATLATFLAAVPAQVGCVGRVGLVGARELGDRAQYEPEDGTITVRIPATAPQLRISLVHELAHHLEFACLSQADIRGDFMLAQEFDEAAEWFEGTTWEDLPSEQWATAVVRHVLNEADPRAPVTIQPQALDVIQAWAGE